MPSFVISLLIVIVAILEIKYVVSQEENLVARNFGKYLSGTNDPKTLQQAKNEAKMCRYRDEGLFPDVIWNWKAGGGCYLYLPQDWFVIKLRMMETQITINNVTYRIPMSQSSGIPLVFDYTNETYSQLISQSFKTNAFYQKWLNCATNADECCSYEMNAGNIHPSELHPCPATWDAWSCFLPAEKDTISEMPCPDYTSSSNDTPCILYSQKTCYPNGTWNQQTEYGTCATAPVYRRRHNFHVIVLYISIALCLPAVIVLMSYRNLRILRVNLHRNLLIACILRNVFAVIQKEIVILDSLKSSTDTNNVLNDNGIPCRVLAFFLSITTNAIYACMLADGFYLHKLIVRIFSPDPNVYILYGIVGVISILPTTIWATLLAIEADQYCWAVDSSWYQWILDGFRIAILSINVILMLDIMRVLLSKLRKNISTHHTKSTLKAMFFLIPLFGVPFIFTANRNIVDKNSCTAGDYYYYVTYSIQALQGVMVATLFCYWNKEVHIQIKRTYDKIKINFNLRLSSDRRETAATYVRNSVSRQNKRLPIVEPQETVKNWLTEVKPSDELVSLGLTEKVQFIENESKEDCGASNSNGLDNRVSRFIDDDPST